MGCGELRAAELKPDPKKRESLQKEPIYPGRSGVGAVTA